MSLKAVHIVFLRYPCLASKQRYISADSHENGIRAQTHGLLHHHIIIKHHRTGIRRTKANQNLPHQAPLLTWICFHLPYQTKPKQNPSVMNLSCVHVLYTLLCRSQPTSEMHCTEGQCDYLFCVSRDKPLPQRTGITNIDFLQSEIWDHNARFCTSNCFLNLQTSIRFNVVYGSQKAPLMKFSLQASLVQFSRRYPPVIPQPWETPP